jgi:branched-chain amino acid transport system substrate-binding protein
MTLPPEVALQPGKITYREGDHKLMAGIFVGEVPLPQRDPANIFTTHSLVPGATAAGSVAETGCKMQMPRI